MRFCRFILISLVFFLPVKVFALEVRVGIYDNPPLVFQDAAGQPQGLYPDLLQAVAEAEGWSLSYVAGTFSEGVERLRSGEIDLMTAIAQSEERADYANFNHRNVLLLWGELLSTPEADIHSLADIDTRRVAVSRGGNNYAAFEELCAQFNFKPEFIVLDGYSEVLKAVADGKAEAGVVSKLFAASQRKHYGLVSTGVIFNPFSLHFAAPADRGMVLLSSLDSYLDIWQNDNDSIYYESVNRWVGLNEKAHSSKIPNWLVPLGLGLGVCLLVALAWAATLRRKVREATAEIAERERATLTQRDNLQQIIDNMPIGVWLSDAAGVLQLENPAGAKIWGRKGMADLSQYGGIRGWWADSGKRLEIEDWGLTRALRHGETCLDERIEIETCDGQRKIILASAMPLLDAEGHLVGVLEVEQDITEHRRSEQKIQDLAHKWQETFDAVGDAIAILDKNSRVVQWNRAFEQFFGKDPEHLCGSLCWSLVHGTDCPISACPAVQMRDSGQSESSEFQMDGRWWFVRVDPVVNEAGEITGAIHIQSDITARKESEALLADERQVLEMVAIGSPLADILERIVLNIQGHLPGALCAVMLIDDDGALLRHGAAPGLSDAYCQAVDGTAIDLLSGFCATSGGRGEPGVVTDIATDPIWESCRDLALGEGLRACWSFPILNNDGEPVAALVTYFRVLRASQPAEIEVVERGARLVQVVLAKHKLEQERQQLVQLLEERNAELEQFTYTVSHDLKTPLVTIGGFVGQLRKDIESGDRDSAAIDLDFIESSVQTLGSLLANLLHLARAGRAISAPREFDLKRVVQVALDFARGTIQDIPVRCDFPDALPALFGDAERLREAVQNLVENAAKFCRDVPHPEIGIGCRLEGGQVVFWVRDNGIGILPQYQEKIFHLFEKLDASQPGTGIGLSVSRRIVEKHGGRLWVESDGNGKGSTFFMVLPLSG